MWLKLLSTDSKLDRLNTSAEITAGDPWAGIGFREDRSGQSCEATEMLLGSWSHGVSTSQGWPLRAEAAGASQTMGASTGGGSEPGVTFSVSKD